MVRGVQPRARMRWTVVCVLALASGCMEEETPDWMPPEPDALPQLLRTRRMAGELPVVGIDSDRAGGLWIAYSLRTGDFYADADLRLVHVNAAGTKLAELRINDEHINAMGIAFDGTALWLNFANRIDDPYVRAIDATTGAELHHWPVEGGVSDLEVDDARGELVLSSTFDRVVAIDLATGVETRRLQLRPEHVGWQGEQSALALTPDGSMWIASRFWDHLEVRDPTGTPIATYTTDLGSDHHTTDYSLFIAWDAQRGEVIAADENQISWLALRGETP